MLDTLPRSLNEGLLAFCTSIANSRPRFIRSKPASNAKLGFCFDNVKAKIKRAAGSIAYGWAIWNLRGVYFEAEHHGVWEKRSGELVDLTPQMNGYKKILFLPDPGAPYNPQTFRSNRMSADGDNPVALRFVEKSLQRNRIIDSYRGVGVEQTYLTPNDQRKVDDLLQELQELLTELLASR